MHNFKLGYLVSVTKFIYFIHEDLQPVVRQIPIENKIKRSKLKSILITI